MNIVVAGAGRMGSWFIRELSKRHGLGVYDPDRAKARAASPAVVLEHPADIKDFNPEILVNAANLSNTRAAFESILPYLSPECLLTDIASVKDGLAGFYRLAGRRFASVHPMFGPTFADLADLGNENAILIRESDKAGLLFWKGFFDGYGVTIHETSFEEHDRLIAYSLALPFTATMVFAACASGQAVPGTTFKKHLAIARGLLSEDDDLLAEIMFNPHALPQLETITQRLEFLKHIVRQKDTQEAVRFFDRLRKNIEPAAESGAGPGSSLIPDAVHERSST